MNRSAIDAVLIAGPTTSGKSAFALEVAQILRGTVVNADSMQVYADLRIITARPTEAEERLAPHELYGVIDGAENFSVGRYVSLAETVLARLLDHAALPIITGGTGLYFKALEEGLSDLPPVPQAIRDVVRDEAEGRPTPELHAELTSVDPDTAARLRPSDRLRILRALEFQRATGGSLSAAQGSRRAGPLTGLRLARFFLAPPRDVLHERVNARFSAMIDSGAIEEVARLAARRLDPALPVMRAHGVPGLIAHLDGRATLDEAIARGQADTRAYVKRQFTWFRHQMAGWRWLESEADRQEALQELRGRRMQRA